MSYFTSDETDLFIHLHKNLLEFSIFTVNEIC